MVLTAVSKLAWCTVNVVCVQAWTSALITCSCTPSVSKSQSQILSTTWKGDIGDIGRRRTYPPCPYSYGGFEHVALPQQGNDATPEYILSHACATINCGEALSTAYYYSIILFNRYNKCIIIELIHLLYLIPCIVGYTSANYGAY